MCGGLSSWFVGCMWWNSQQGTKLVILDQDKGTLRDGEIEPVRAGISMTDAVEFGFSEPEMTPSFSR